MTHHTANNDVAAFQAACGVEDEPTYDEIRNTQYRMEGGELRAVRCPGCGEKVQGYGRGATGKTFCSNPCRQAFNNRMKAEGAPVAALVKAWTMTRHAKPGTREADVCRFAMSQLTQIARDFNERDITLARPSAVEYVETLMRSGTLYCDRARDWRRD